MGSSLNVIVCGETGVGKGSVINMIAGREIAKVSPDAKLCTTSFIPYSLSVSSRALNIWDTVDLAELAMGVNSYLLAIEEACELIHPCQVVVSSYRLFYEVLCRSKVPVALVITHLEREADMEKWWTRNMESLEKLGIGAAGHACVTTLSRHNKYRESQYIIARLLEGHNSDRRFNMPPEGWLIEFLHLLGPFASLKKGSKRKDIMKVLTKRYRLDPKKAEGLTARLTGGD